MTLESSVAWWRSAVIYQIYPRSLMDTNGDGIGDLQGILNRLPYFSDTLGVDAIWISPFFSSPMKDFGYDVSNFVDVDPLFGTLEDAERLIEEIHRHGMRVILDYVSNHSSDQHAWFLDSRSSLSSTNRDWYIWRDPADDGGPPNNWLSVFGGPAWSLDKATGQYYLHTFLPSQPDLNWRNPGLREAMHDVLRFWIDRGVDGFRIDAAHYVGKDELLRDNPAAKPGAKVMHRPMGDYDTQEHIFDKGTALAHEVYQSIRQLLDTYAQPDEDRLMIGEMHLFDWDEWASYFGPNLDEFHLPYNFGLLQIDWSADAIRNLSRNIEKATPTGAWPNWVIGNHDERRVASRLGAEQARAALAILLTLRGTPTIYYGDELGFVDGDIPEDRRQDPWGSRVTELDLGRDPGRCPMLWTRSHAGRFCDPEVEPWLPVIDAEIYSVEAQIDDPRSMLSLTRALLGLRRERVSLQTGDFIELEGLPAEIFGYVREAGGEQTFVLASMSQKAQSFQNPAAGELNQLLSTNVEAESVIIPQGGLVTLRPNEVIIGSGELEHSST
jgi:alpha-glucosidase